MVLRFLTAEPAHQADVALAFLKEMKVAGRRVVVSDLVVSEAYFALQAHYQVPKKAAVGVLLEFLQSGFVEQEAHGVAVEALKFIAFHPKSPKAGICRQRDVRTVWEEPRRSV
jgi:predicted nucleic acid-binding protein